MKKQLSSKRLRVSKQTLKGLTAEETAQVNGGGEINYPFPSISCYRTNCCNSRVCP